MTATEIRELQKVAAQTAEHLADGDPDLALQGLQAGATDAIWEIAAQLAELNENIRTLFQAAGPVQ